MTRPARTVIAVIATTIAAALASCGVPTEDTARSIDPPRTRDHVTPAPVVTTSGPFLERLYLVKAGAVVAVQRQLPTQPTAQELIRDLIAGPTDTEHDDGITSALIGSTAINRVDVTDGTAIIDLSAGLEGTGRNDDVLAFAQLVCTLTQRPDIRQVAFTRNGQAIGVPRGDGALTSSPLTPTDYAALLGGT
jgi:hypothetical protein